MTPDEDKTRQLWCAVIQQAIDDATRVAFPTTPFALKQAIAARIDARAWFKAGDKDFVEACALAGLDPKWVQAGALDAIAAHDEKHPDWTPFAERPPIVIKTVHSGMRQQTGKPSRLYTFDGKTHTLNEWATLLGVASVTLLGRIKEGKPPERVFVGLRSARAAGQQGLGHREGGGSRPLPFDRGPAGGSNNRSHENEIPENQDLAA